MRIAIADRELAPLWNLMTNSPSFGGNEDSLLAQMELWTAFNFDDGRFKAILGGQAIDLATLSEEPQGYDLSPNAIAILRSALASGGQSLPVAKLSHAAIMRIRDAVSKEQASATPGVPSAA